MKNIFRPLNDLFKSKDTLLAESVIEKSFSNMYRVTSAYMPLMFKYNSKDVTLDEMPVFFFRAETQEHRVIACCSVTIHKWLPLISGVTTSKPPVDVYVTIQSMRVRLIDIDGKEIYVRSSNRMEDLISKAIYKSIQIEG